MFNGKLMRVVGMVVMLAAGGIALPQRPITETMVYIGSVDLAWTGDAVIDEDAGYAYFTSGGSVVKAALDGRMDLPRIVATTKVGDSLGSAVIDPIAGYAYFGSNSYSGSIYKVALGKGDAPPVLTAVLELEPEKEMRSPQGTAVIDPTAGYAYFGFSDYQTASGSDNTAASAHVVKIALGEGDAPPTRIGGLSMPDWRSVRDGLIDPLNGYAYFRMDGSYVFKIALGEGTTLPTVVGKVFAASSPGAAIDAQRGVAYYVGVGGGSGNGPPYAYVEMIGLGEGDAPPFRLPEWRAGWAYSTFQTIMVNPSDGILYISTGDNYLLKLSAAGNTLETLTVAGPLGQSVMSPAKRAVFRGTGTKLQKIILDATVGETLSLPNEWHFAEGATHSTFQTYYLLANPKDEPLLVEAEFLPESGAPLKFTVNVPANSRHTILANAILPNQGLAASFRAPSGKGFAAERAMYSMGPNHRWYGGHAAVGIAEPKDTWYFAEGSAGFAGPGGDPFQTFILMANPNDFPVTARMSFAPESGFERRHTVVIPPKRRVTVEPGRVVAGLAGTSFSTAVTVDGGHGIFAERAMWWRAKNWIAGSHFMEGTASPGLPETSHVWYLAEGNTDGFDDFILLSNRSDRLSYLEIEYHFETGSPIRRTLWMKPSERRTINMRWDPEGIGKDARYGATISATEPIAVERSMYFNRGGFGWVGGHNSLASPRLSRKWLFPEGATVPGPVENIRTEIQILNPQSNTTNVELRFLMSGGVTHSELISIPGRTRHTILANDIPELASKSFSTLVLSNFEIAVHRTMYFDGDTPELLSPIGSTGSAGIPVPNLIPLSKDQTTAAPLQSATSNDGWTLYSPTPTATVTPTPVLLE